MKKEDIPKMKPLMNPKLDQELINQNRRLSYFNKLSNGIVDENETNQKQLVNTFIKESHIPHYMYKEDVKEVQAFINHKRIKHASSVIISLLIFFASVGVIAYSELTDAYKLAGSLAVLTASVAFSAFIIANDRLFVKPSQLQNIKHVIDLIKNIGEPNEQTN